MTKKHKKFKDNKQRGSWFGVDPRTKIIPDKKKQNDKTKCRRNKNGNR